MALVHADFVRETTTTTGTGTLSLGGATTGCRTFVSAIGDGNTCYYAIETSTGQFESGIGTVTDASPDTVARTTLITSSTGAKLDLPAGTHTVYCAFSANLAGTLVSQGVLAGTALQPAAIGTTITPAAIGAAPIDPNGIVTAANVVGDTAITVTSGQTITLTRASKRRQMFTGTESVTVILPVVSTLELGFAFIFDSDTTGTVDVKSSGANAVVSLAQDQWAEVSCRAITGTGASSWDVHRPEPAQTAASQAEAEAGTQTALRSWSPQRIRQAAISADSAAPSIHPFLLMGA